MLNRDVLNGVIILGGNYANDLLQTICSHIFHYDSFKTAQMIQKYHLDKEPYESDVDKQELESQMKAQHRMITMFNAIVFLGKDHAVRFIENNYEQFKLKL